MIRRFALSLLSLALVAGPMFAASPSCQGSCCAMEMGAMVAPMDGMAPMGMGKMAAMDGEDHGCCCGDSPNPCEWEKSPLSNQQDRATAALVKVDSPHGPTVTLAETPGRLPTDLFSQPQGFPAGASPPGGPPVYLTLQSFLC